MRYPPALSLALALGLLAQVTEAQQVEEAQGWFAGANLGLLHQDVQSPSESRSNGVSVLARLGRDLGARLAVVGEIGWLSTTRNTDIVFAPCDPAQGCFGGVFLGPTAMLTTGVSLRLMTSPSLVRGFLTGGPALSWAARRETGTRAVAVGGVIGGGLTVRVGGRTSLVGEVTYREFGSDGTTPRWLVPMTIGIEVR
jgi:hypothetical protein